VDTLFVRGSASGDRLRPEWNIKRDDVWSCTGEFLTNGKQRWNIGRAAANSGRPVDFIGSSDID
jgi:hypothetical protein